MSLPILRLLVASLALAAAPAGAAPPASPSVPTPAATQQISPSDARADLAHLYTGLQEAHYDLFARRPRAEYAAEYRRLHDALDAPMTLATLRRRLQRFVAYGNVAHARIAPPAAEWEAHRSSGGKAFPLFLRVVDGRVFIADDYSGVGGLAIGDEVRSVDGTPALAWLQRFRGLVSADNDYLAYAQMETQLPVLVWWHGRQADAYRVELARGDEPPRTVTVPARSRAGFEAAQAAQPPRFELDWNARVARMAEHRIAYLRPGPLYDNRPEAETPWDPSAFRAFIDQALAGFIADDAAALLIDLRNNPGGDNSFSDPLLAWIADAPFRFTPRFEIRVSPATIASNARRLASAGGDPDATSVRLAAAYAGQAPGSLVEYPIPLVPPRDGARFTRPAFVLINRHTYSNAVLVVAIAQDYGFATVLGEETADLASTYGAAETFTLPRSGIEVSYPKARILRPNGNADARGVIPDIAIPEPVTMQRSDSVLEAAMRAVTERLRQ